MVMSLNCLSKRPESRKKHVLHIWITTNLRILSGLSFLFFYNAAYILILSKHCVWDLRCRLKGLGIILNEDQIKIADNIINEANKKNSSLLKIAIPATIISVICLITFYFLSRKIRHQKNENKKNTNERQNDKQRILATLCLITSCAVIAAGLACITCTIGLMLETLLYGFSPKPIFSNILTGVDLEILRALDLPTKQAEIFKDSLKPCIALALAFLIIIGAITTYFCIRITLKQEVGVIFFCIDEIRGINREIVEIDR